MALMGKSKLSEYGITAEQLAELTGQTRNSIYRKLNQTQGQHLGPREHIVLAWWTIATETERKLTLERFERLNREGI